MAQKKTARGTIEYDGNRIEGCINEVYRGIYVDGNDKGKQVILKYTEDAGAEARLITAVSDAGIDTPGVLEATQDYLVLEYRDMQNIADYAGNIDPATIARNLARFHSKLYNNQGSLEEKIIDKRTESQRTQEKLGRITKESAAYRAARALWSGLTSEASRYSFEKEIEKLLSQVPDGECVAHRDQTGENGITDGENVNFIDFRWLGKAYFAADAAKLALCLKAEGAFDEKGFVDAYYDELNSQIGDRIGKTREQFETEYNSAKILIGLSWAPIYVDCLSDPNRKGIAPARLDSFVYNAFDEMDDKQRNSVLGMLSNKDNKYSREILNSANKWRRKNQSRARVWLDDKKRALFRNLAPVKAGVAGLILLASVAYGHYKVMNYLEKHPEYAAAGQKLLKDSEKIEGQFETIDTWLEMQDKKLKEADAECSDEFLDEDIVQKIIVEGLK
ncbi:hypothetical protein KY338_05740 [Candidatus Woesearchaeota archaeon]|nr:hypothetical protein [Candidatus Woesearchaeota archaeon]MBW3006448.1 hypothetical protein [Candidatus Woesearchaeota archaeon]